MPQPRLANLFIVGAMKAGTSSLHEYLHQHPEIFMSRFKEPQFFAPHCLRTGQWWGQGQPYPEGGERWYLDLFKDAGSAKYAGESSVSYSARPWATGCELRIHEFNAIARIIYIMRDPVERALSHYWQFVADGRESLSPLTAMRRHTDYVARSDYAMQLRPYLRTFGERQVLTLTLEELEADSKAVFRRIFAWLGVDAAFAVDVESRHNVGRAEYRQTRRGLVWLDTTLKHWRWRAIARRLPAAPLGALDRIAHRRVVRAEVDVAPATHYLQERLRSPIAELRRLLGRDFPEWTTFAPNCSYSREAMERRSRPKVAATNMNSA